MRFEDDSNDVAMAAAVKINAITKRQATEGRQLIPISSGHPLVGMYQPQIITCYAG